MCDYSGRLIAWLDHELPENEAADLERHVRACTECRNELDSYARASRAFDAYCDAACDSAMTSNGRRRVPRWAAALSAAAAAAAVALLLIFPRPPAEQPRLHPQAAATSPAKGEVDVDKIVPESAPAGTNVIHPVQRTRRKHAVAPMQNQNAIWTPAEPAIEIAIPADAMFPPGAVPEGVNFIADLSIGSDGSVQRLRLRPRLAGFERRPTQP